MKFPGAFVKYLAEAFIGMLCQYGTLAAPQMDDTENSKPFVCVFRDDGSRTTPGPDQCVPPQQHQTLEWDSKKPSLDGIES